MLDHIHRPVRTPTIVSFCRHLLLGIGSNTNMSELELDLSRNSLGLAGAQVLELCVPDIMSIASLDLSDNGTTFSLSTRGPFKCYLMLFIWKFNTYPPPRNANNVEPYTFVTFFYENLIPPLHYVTLEWPQSKFVKFRLVCHSTWDDYCLTRVKDFCAIH